jgi:hypothetical protein
MTVETDPAATTMATPDTVCVLTVIRARTLDHLSVHATEAAADNELRQHVAASWDSYWTGPLEQAGRVTDAELAHHLAFHGIKADVERLPIR